MTGPTSDLGSPGRTTSRLYLHNSNEYLEGMLGAFKARVAPFNVNYRYVREELEYLLADSQARAIIYHSAFVPTLAEVLPQLPELDVLIQVDDGTEDLLPGARWYEHVLADAATTPPAVVCSPDDLYLLYTGGTTGMPKCVLWRQGDVLPAAMGGRDLSTGEEWPNLTALVDHAKERTSRILPAPPFMHAAAHWIAFTGLNGGGTVVLPNVVDRLDAADLWRTVQDERVDTLAIVGDAFAQPLLDELDRSDYDLSSLALIVSGGATLSARSKDQLLDRLPTMIVVDMVGSSEAGGQAANTSLPGRAATTGTFTPVTGTVIIHEDLTRLVEPAEGCTGWLGQTGRVPLGYLNDPAKTGRTFPLVDGVRYSLPGDRASYLADASIALLGRDAVTINTGGEKVFAEEVERALSHHPSVYDTVVAGRPSERWGHEVVAIVRLRDGHAPDPHALRQECAKHLAAYKLPKDFIFVTEVARNPSGKADYRWARELAEASEAG